MLKVLEKEYSLILNQNLDWRKNILVSAGATSVLSYIYMSMKEKDELISIEPYFPWYNLPVRLFGGKVKFTRMGVKDG